MLLQGKAFRPSKTAPAPARLQNARRLVAARSAAPTTETVKSRWLDGIAFMNPVWAGVENEQQFFAVLKVGWMSV